MGVTGDSHFSEKKTKTQGLSGLSKVTQLLRVRGRIGTRLHFDSCSFPWQYPPPALDFGLGWRSLEGKMEKGGSLYLGSSAS